MSGPEQYQPEQELNGERIARAIVKTLVHIDLLDPQESICVKRNPWDWLWAARIEVEPEDVARAREHFAASDVPALFLDVYHEDLLGQWVVSGENAKISHAFRFPGAEQARAVLFEQVGEYFAGDDQLTEGGDA